MSSITSRLERLESQIEDYQKHRLKAGQALKEIAEDDLYEQRDYESLVKYAQKRYGFRSGRTYQLIRYARVHGILDEEDNTPTPVNEAQARYLGRLLDTEHENDIPTIWSDVVDASDSGVEGLTMREVQAAISAHLEDDEEEDEPQLSEVDLSVPISVAEDLGLDGDDDGDRRVVAWNGYTRSDITEIVNRTDSVSGAPPNNGAEPVLASKVWGPLEGEETIGPLRSAPPERVEFMPDEAQRLEEANNLTGDPATTLTCPNVDLLSDDVPDPLTAEILDRSDGTGWEPVLVSDHYDRWVNHSLPDDAWVGTRADRGSIEGATNALNSADDTEVKWALYDINGDDRNHGFPEIDLSALDWIVIDSLNHPNVDLPYYQLVRLWQSIEDQDIALAVRGTFTTRLKTTPQ